MRERVRAWIPKPVVFRVPGQPTSCIASQACSIPQLSSQEQSYLCCLQPRWTIRHCFIYVTATASPPGAGCPPSDKQVFRDPTVSDLDWHCFCHSKNKSMSPSASSPTWEILVDLVHFQHDIIWHPSFSQQHVELARHPACDWVNSKPRCETNEQLALLDGPKCTETPISPPNRHSLFLAPLLLLVLSHLCRQK